MVDSTRTKHALLAGVSVYQHKSSLPDLRTPINDVKDLQRVLSTPECDFHVDTLENPTRAQLELEVAKLFKVAGAADLLLFYFSGHGKLSPEGTLFLCTTDTEPELLEGTAVDLSWLKQRIDKTRAQQVVIVLDSCYSGAAEGSFKGDIPSALQANLGQGHGKFLITSSTAIQPSLEKPGDQNSLFTKWLIKGLESWEADLSHDDILTIQELYLYANEKVRNESEQQPKDWGFGVTPGEVEIARRVRATSPAPLPEPSHPDFFLAVRPLLEQSKIIPFLGEGMFGGGPLSCFNVISDLAKRAGLKVDEQYTLPTAAEYLERLRDDREVFLHDLTEILEDQSTHAAQRAMHKVISLLPRPWFVISGTYDAVLERYLQNQGQPYVVVSHILRSEDDKYNGRILVLHKGEQQSTEIVLADQLHLDKNECVIYKVLGSPFLHDEVEPELGLDTVVITESDHTRFLAYLDNQHTMVPTAFSRLFQTRHMLFLGYNLDTWHYRLVACIFSRTGHVKMTKRPFAVRQPTSPIEELFWRHLEANLIHSDVEAFIHTLHSQ